MDRNWTLAFCDVFFFLLHVQPSEQQILGKTQWMFKWRLKAGWMKEKTKNETGKKDGKEKSYFLFRQFIMHKHFTLWSNISSSLMYIVCQWCTIFLAQFVFLLIKQNVQVSWISPNGATNVFHVVVGALQVKTSRTHKHCITSL